MHMLTYVALFAAGFFARPAFLMLRARFAGPRKHADVDALAHRRKLPTFAARTGEQIHAGDVLTVDSNGQIRKARGNESDRIMFAAGEDIHSARVTLDHENIIRNEKDE